MEDEPVKFTCNSLPGFCKNGQLFWPCLGISTTILVALVLFTFPQVYQGKEFTAQEISFNAAVFAVCLLTITASITCRLYGLKMGTNQTSTEGMTQTLIGPVVASPCIPRSAETFV